MHRYSARRGYQCRGCCPCLVPWESIVRVDCGCCEDEIVAYQCRAPDMLKGYMGGVVEEDVLDLKLPYVEDPIRCQK